MAKLTDEEKAKLKEEKYKLTLQSFTLLIFINIVFIFTNIFIGGGDYSMRSNIWLGYFIVGMTFLVSLVGFKKERKEHKVVRRLIYFTCFIALILLGVTFKTETNFSNTLKTGEVVSTKTYKVEDVKVNKDFYLFYSETSYEVTYEKNGKLKTVTLSEGEGKEYKDYNRHKPTYKLEVTEYSYTKEFKKKYPEFEGRASKQKLILERSGD